MQGPLQQGLLAPPPTRSTRSRRFTVNLASGRLAVWLIGLLLFMIVLAALIPQEGLPDRSTVDWSALLGEHTGILSSLGLTRVYSSPFFYLLLGLLVVNLTAANIRRIRIIRHSRQTSLKVRYIGSVVFHFALVVVIAGVVLHGLYRYDGVMALTEGQTAYDAPEAYFREFQGPLARRSYQGFSIRLDRVEPDYAVKTATTTAAILSLAYPGMSGIIPDTARTNRPVKFAGYEIHYGQRTGFSPELVILDSTGRTVFRSFIRLAVQEREGRKVFADLYTPPGFGRTVEIKVEAAADDPADAVYELIIRRGDEVRFGGRVTGRDTVTVDGYQVMVPRLRRWCYLNVVSNPFLDVVFAGFWLVLAGMAVAFFPRVFAVSRR